MIFRMTLNGGHPFRGEWHALIGDALNGISIAHFVTLYFSTQKEMDFVARTEKRLHLHCLLYLKAYSPSRLIEISPPFHDA
jgi:hypothetical protein